MQHDCHEFLAYLFEQLSDEQTPVTKKKFEGEDPEIPLDQLIEDFQTLNPSIIDRIFGGLMQNVVRCGKCRHESITTYPFTTISLSCKSSLNKAMQDHFKEKAIDDYYTCEKCNKNSKAKKRHHLVKIPKVVVF